MIEHEKEVLTMKTQMRGRDFLSVLGFNREEIESILDLAFRLKADVAGWRTVRTLKKQDAVYAVLQPFFENPQQL